MGRGSALSSSPRRWRGRRPRPQFVPACGCGNPVQHIVNITVLAAIYALLACGYVLIYRVSRVMNMAHGELAMLGAYLLYTTAALFTEHPVTAVFAAVVLSLTVGVVVYVLLMRKMTGQMVLAAILTTIPIRLPFPRFVVLILSAPPPPP